MGSRLSTSGSSATGSVTSVGLSASGLLHTVSGSPVTTSGVLALTLKTQVAGTALLGPVSGADAAPTMRALDPLDIPALDAAKVTSGTFADARLASGITGSKISGALSGATLATSALTGTITASQLAASAPTSGQLGGLTTSNLSASAALVAGQIASVNPSVLTGSGTVPLAGLTGITTTQLSATAGLLAGQLAVSAPSSGQLGGLTTSNLSASAALVAGQIASVNPSVLTGSGTVPVAGLPAATTSAKGAIQIATQTPVPETTTGAAGTATTAAPGDHAHQTPGGLWLPDDHSLLAWSYDPVMCSGGGGMSAGVVFLIKIKLTAAISVTNVIFGIQTVGASLSNCFAGLYNSSGTLLGTSADQSSNWTTQGLRTIALVSGPFSVGPGTCFVGLLAGAGSSTPSALVSANNQQSVVNAGLATSASRFGTYGTSQTSLPTPLTLGSIANTVRSCWAALS